MAKTINRRHLYLTYRHKENLSKNHAIRLYIFKEFQYTKGILNYKIFCLTLSSLHLHNECQSSEFPQSRTFSDGASISGSKAVHIVVVKLGRQT